jgi:peptidyl-prolyl cis-trans isomerase SurA
MITDNEAQKRLAELREKILKGEDFAQLAKAHSNDLASSNNGGSLGWISKEVVVADFRNVMEKLNVEEISEPFKSPFGWHIVQVMDRKTQTNDEAGLRQKARQMIQQRKYEEKLQAWSRQMRDEAYVKINAKT